MTSGKRRVPIGLQIIGVILSVFILLFVVILSIDQFMDTEKYNEVGDLQAFSKDIAKRIKPSHSRSKSRIKDMEDTLKNLGTSYEEVDFMLNNGMNVSEITNILEPKDFESMCRRLPDNNRFSNHSFAIDLKLESESDQEHLFHLMLLYPKLQSKFLCVVEGMIHNLNQRKEKNPKLIIWISSRNGQKIDSSDQEIYTQILNSSQFPIEFKYLDPVQIFEGTLLEGFFNCMKMFSLDLGRYIDQNIGNAARLAILYKYGGFYLDWDFLVSGDLLSLSQGLGYQKKNSLNNGVLSFNKRSEIINGIFKEFMGHYDGNRWGNNGPACLNRAFGYNIKCKGNDAVQKVCEYNGVQEPLEFWPIETAYPVPYSVFKTMADPLSNFNASKYDASVLIHLWHHQTGPREKQSCIRNQQGYRTSLLGRLRKRYCPVIFEYIVTKKKCTF